MDYRRKEMITLHEAIRSVQDELIKSQQEREQKGIPPLFVTEKLTIELSCAFSETDSTETKGGVNALSVFALDAASTNSVSSEKIQKVILEFKTIESKNVGDSKNMKNNEGDDPRSIPKHKPGGEYPYKKNN